MKKALYTLAVIAVVCLLGSCTDDFDETNANPNKVYDTTVQSVFPGTVLRTINTYAEMNYNKYLLYSRYAKLWYEIGDAEGDMDNYSRKLYVDILRDLCSVEKQNEGLEGNENRLMIVKTWKAFIYSIIVATWGPTPMSDAMLSDGKVNFKYDTEKDLYIQILDLLKTASEGFNPKPLTNDYLNPDPVFGGNTEANIEKWRKFANTLRLEIGLRMENIDKTIAETNIKESMAHQDWFISSLDDMVAPGWGKDVANDVSYYWDRILKNITDGTFPNIYPRIGQYLFTYMYSYDDPRLPKYVDIPAYKDRYAITDTITAVRKSTYTGQDTTIVAEVKHSVPYVPAPDLQRQPNGWNVAIDPNSINQSYLQYAYRDIDDKTSWSYVSTRFIGQEGQVVFLNWATSCFLRAEAKYKYPDVAGSSTEEYYNEGIAASFAEYGISNEDLTAYMARDGIKWGTNGKGFEDCMGIYHADINGADDQLEQIIKQRWIAEFFNGFDGWTLERRTRVLNLPPLFYNGSPSMEGTNGSFDFSPERFVYPINEKANNGTEYAKGIQILQENSPKGDPVSRWGDNLWTCLQFAKVNPQLAGEEKWRSGTVYWNQHILQGRYGKTEEEMIRIAQKEFPAVKDSATLGEYLKYEFVSIIKPVEEE